MKEKFFLAANDCHCDGAVCLMSEKLVGSDGHYPYQFSQCSRNDYIDFLKLGQGRCLFNEPMKVS